MCRRSLPLNHQTPSPRRHKTTWLYHLPESRHITLRCYINTQWLTYAETLSGNGVISNATRCSVSTTQIHTLTELHTTSEATLHTPHLHVPEKISIVTDHETQILGKLSPELIQQLDGVKSRVMASPRNLDVDNIVHVNHASLQQERQSHWNLIIIAIVCLIMFIGTLCFSLRSHIYRQILPWFSTHKPPKPHTELQVIPSPSTPTQKQAKQPTLIRRRAWFSQRIRYNKPPRRYNSKRQQTKQLQEAASNLQPSTRRPQFSWPQRILERDNTHARMQYSPRWI